jgi:hypothetical protein
LILSAAHKALTLAGLGAVSFTLVACSGAPPCHSVECPLLPPDLSAHVDASHPVDASQPVDASEAIDGDTRD